jgi:hypothetical protein
MYLNYSTEFASHRINWNFRWTRSKNNQKSISKRNLAWQKQKRLVRFRCVYACTCDDRCLVWRISLNVWMQNLFIWRFWYNVTVMFRSKKKFRLCFARKRTMNKSSPTLMKILTDNVHYTAKMRCEGSQKCRNLQKSSSRPIYNV